MRRSANWTGALQYSSEVPQRTVPNETSAGRHEPSDLVSDRKQPDRVHSIGSGFESPAAHPGRRSRTAGSKPSIR